MSPHRVKITKLWHSPSFLLGCLIAVALIGITSLALTVTFALDQSASNRHELHRQQDAFCGFFQAAAHAPTTVQTSQLGQILVKSAGHTTIVLKCPPSVKKKAS